MARSADCSLGAGGPSTRPRRTVRCSAAHGRAQARAASAAFGQLVGIQCMKTGSLLRNTRGWQRQLRGMLEGISGTERRLHRSRRGLARTTRFLHRSTGEHISLLHTVSRLACSHVILNGSLPPVHWEDEEGRKEFPLDVDRNRTGVLLRQALVSFLSISFRAANAAKTFTVGWYRSWGLHKSVYQ